MGKIRSRQLLHLTAICPVIKVTKWTPERVSQAYGGRRASFHDAGRQPPGAESWLPSGPWSVQDPDFRDFKVNPYFRASGCHIMTSIGPLMEQRTMKKSTNKRRYDFLTPAQRSERMKRVRRSATTEEQILFEAIASLGFKPARNERSLPGCPDIVFHEHRLAVFVDGDFWHGREWFSSGRAPKGNRAFWVSRFESNRRRDRRCDRALRRMGWRVSRVWGSAVRRTPLAIAARLVRRAEKGGCYDA